MKRFITEKQWAIASRLVFHSPGRATLFFKMNSEDIFHDFILHPPERTEWWSSMYAWLPSRLYCQPNTPWLKAWLLLPSIRTFLLITRRAVKQRKHNQLAWQRRGTPHNWQKWREMPGVVDMSPKSKHNLCHVTFISASYLICWNPHFLGCANAREHTLCRATVRTTSNENEEGRLVSTYFAAITSMQNK